LTSSSQADAWQPSPKGRWSEPDPAGLAAVNPSVPQSWNRYAYVENEPLNLEDPVGLFTCGSIWVSCGLPGVFGPNGGGSGGSGPHVPSIDAPPGNLPGGNGGAGGGKMCFSDSSGTVHCTVAAPAPSSTSGEPLSILACTSETANVFSIAGLINANPKSRITYAVTQAFAGNSFSGIVDAGGHVYSFGKTYLTAPTLGATATPLIQTSGDLLLGGAAQGIPGIGKGWTGKGAAGFTMDAAINFATKAEPILSVAAPVAEVGAEGLAGPIGWAKFGVDGLIFTASAASCILSRE
jgi:hypothetical protein